MKTLARIVNGLAVDIVVTPPELAERFHPDWLARQVFVVVPDGTENGAVDNGNGTFTNPPPVEAVEVPIVLSAIERLEAKVDALAAANGVDLQAAVATATAAKQG